MNHPPLRPRSRAYTSLAAGLLLLASSPALASAPADAATRAAVLGTPADLQVQPASITLSGPRARQQVVVTGRYADGSVRDLTAFCELSCDSADLAGIEAVGYLAPKKNGASALVVKAGAKTVKVPLTVKDLDRPQPVS